MHEWILKYYLNSNEKELDNLKSLIDKILENILESPLNYKFWVLKSSSQILNDIIFLKGRFGEKIFWEIGFTLVKIENNIRFYKNLDEENIVWNKLLLFWKSW